MSFDLSDPDRDDRVLAEINVTPLVDVMLVLLIIFMIATPMLHQGMEVDLPRAEAETLALERQDPIVLTVPKEPDVVYWKDTPIHTTQLVERLRPIVSARAGETVFVLGDRAAAYGRVLAVIDVLNRAGITKVALVTEPAPRPRRRR